jgi:hypothetical protein
MLKHKISNLNPGPAAYWQATKCRDLLLLLKTRRVWKTLSLSLCFFNDTEPIARWEKTVIMNVDLRRVKGISGYGLF